MHIYRCEVYTTSTMHLAVLVGHAMAEDASKARALIRQALEPYGMKMHVGQLFEVAFSPIRLSPEEPVRLTRYSAIL